MDTIALAVALAALVAGGLALWMAVEQRRRRSVATRSDHLMEMVRHIDEDLANVEAAVAKLVPTVQSLVERMPGALRYAAVVTFDASEERTGHLSRAIALLNERRDGLVITLLVGPRQTLFFTKMVSGGKGLEPLSPEEQTAVDRALGKK